MNTLASITSSRGGSPTATTAAVPAVPGDLFQQLLATAPGGGTSSTPLTARERQARPAPQDRPAADPSPALPR
ncbi:MAG: hypothetical protein JWM67_3085, partial [Mycobacterium sp.]|nr:hypothetical protein [Mycobacterium sp.]